MPIAHHDLQHDFPEFHDRIHALKSSSAHFARLFDEHHEVRRIEQEIETPSDTYTDAVKLRRVRLKDELYAMLRA